MSALDLTGDDGFLKITFDGGEIDLDLFAVNDRIYEYHQKNKTLPENNYNEGLLDIMVELGLPRGSHRMAQRFVRGITQAVEELKKK